MTPSLPATKRSVVARHLEARLRRLHDRLLAGMCWFCPTRNFRVCAKECRKECCRCQGAKERPVFTQDSHSEVLHLLHGHNVFVRVQVVSCMHLLVQTTWDFRTVHELFVRTCGFLEHIETTLNPSYRVMMAMRADSHHAFLSKFVDAQHAAKFTVSGRLLATQWQMRLVCVLRVRFQMRAKTKSARQTRKGNAP